MDIVFDANFTLYAQGLHPEGSSLFTIDVSTGAATFVGDFSESVMGIWSSPGHNLCH